jgi:exosome complex RNA-binding protein Rrp4
LPILDGTAFNHLAILLLIGSGKLQSGQAIFIHCFNVDQMVKEQCYTLPSTKIVINIVAEDGFKWITCKTKKNVIM